MSTRHIIAAAASVAILASTLAIFQSSSHPRVYAATAIDGAARYDTQPVRSMPRTPVSERPARTRHASKGYALPSLHNASLKTGSALFMPYYSFANNLHTIIKE